MPPGSRGTSTGNDSGGGRTGGASAGGLGGGNGGGGLSSAVRGAINAANSAVGLSGLAGTGSGPQMDAATRARISNVQKNATHQFMGQLDDANNTDDPMGSLGAALAGMIGLHEQAPQPGDTFNGTTYDNDPRANWSFDPVRLGTSLVGGVTGIPGLGYLGGKFSDAIGNPGSINLGKDVFGSSAGAPTMGGAPSSAVTAGDIAGATPSRPGVESGRQGSTDDVSPQDTPEDRQRKLMLAQQYQQKNGIPGMGVDMSTQPDGGAPRPDGQFLEGPGDGRSDSIDAKVADGEYIVPADVVSAIGNGSSKSGSRALGALVHKTRKNYGNHLASLPQPKK